MTSMSTAVIYIVSQYLDLPAITKTFWRGIIPLVCITPLLFFIELPTSPIFYIATCITSLLAAYGDTKNFEATVKYGAGIVTRMKPFAIWFIFIIWFFLSAETRESLLSQPIKSLGIIITLIIGVISASFMARCAISRSALRFYIPIICFAVLTDILNKTAMDNSPLLSGVVTYVWIQALIITLIMAFMQHKDARYSYKDIFTPKLIKAGLLIGSLFVFANLTKNSAMSFTSNPAYVTAITFANPVFVTLYYKWIKHKEQANIYAGYGVVASAIALVILAQ